MAKKPRPDLAEPPKRPLTHAQIERLLRRGIDERYEHGGSEAVVDLAEAQDEARADEAHDRAREGGSPDLNDLNDLTHLITDGAPS